MADFLILHPRNLLFTQTPITLTHMLNVIRLELIFLPWNAADTKRWRQYHPQLVRAVYVERTPPHAEAICCARRLSSPLQRRVVAWPPNQKLRHIPHNSPEWTAETTTCLSLGLDPSDPDVGSYACGGCKEY